MINDDENIQAEEINKEPDNNDINKETNINQANTTEENNKTDESKENNANKNTKKSPVKKALNVVRRIIETIIWTLIIFVVAMLLMVSVSQKKAVFGYRLYIIISGSMEPTIHIKQAVITKEVEEPQVGDIIAFEYGNSTTMHRITKVYTEGENRLYQTKGDNNNDFDKELVKKENVRGKVQYILPGVGEAVFYLQHNIPVLIGAIGILVIIIVARRLI